MDNRTDVLTYKFGFGINVLLSDIGTKVQKERKTYNNYTKLIKSGIRYEDHIPKGRKCQYDQVLDVQEGRSNAKPSHIHVIEERCKVLGQIYCICSQDIN